MNRRYFELEGGETAGAIREWVTAETPPVDVAAIEREVRQEGDEALLRLTARFDATEAAPKSLRVEMAQAEEALAGLSPSLREAFAVAAENIRAVAEAQLAREPVSIELPQGQRVSIREAAVEAAGLYAPGGNAAYPSSVLMCAIPARVAGVERLALASPPGPDGKVNPLVLAAAVLGGVDEIYAMGGAQAIFALACGTESIDPVDVVAGPGNAWVREAKRAVSGRVGIDSLAGPSELMIVAGPETPGEWAALDLCAQAEHGEGGALVVASTVQEVLELVAAATEVAIEERGIDANTPLALVRVPSPEDAIELANAFAPEHLELLDESAAKLASRVTSAGCVFTGRHGATAFGDYVAGSNHVLPTGGAGRFSGPLGPDTFRRKVPTVEVSAAAAAKLAPYVDAIAKAEGFPVHGESAMIRR